MRPLLPSLLAAAAAAATAHAGPFPPAAGRPGSDAVAADSPDIVAWATAVTALVRGPEEIDDPSSLPASYGSAESALGRADVVSTTDQPEPDTLAPKPSVSLGDGGSITLRFDPPITDGPGPDFAVFENGISFNGGASFFMELAFVEASSDGLTFTRFPAFSETPTAKQLGAYAAIDPTNVLNLAGKYVAGYGTPFDVAALAPTPGLNPLAISHIRVVDVTGSINPLYARYDSLGRIINDPWPTFLTTSGFDLDAVGVIHQAAPVGTYAAWSAGFVWPPDSGDPAADPDDDGQCNLMEYALGSSPLTPGPQPSPALTVTPAGWVAVLPALSPDARDVIADAEISTDLKSWTLRPGTDPVDLTPAAPGTSMFCRLRLSLRTGR